MTDEADEIKSGSTQTEGSPERDSLDEATVVNQINAEYKEHEVEFRSSRQEPPTFNEQVSLVTNNFWMRWPGGWYRELKRDERFYADFDGAIKECGCEDKIDIVLNRNYESLGEELWHERQMALAKVYLNMRQKGYTREQLR